MKKLMYIMAGLILVIGLTSCEKQNKNDLFGDDAIKVAKSSKVVDLGDSTPISRDGSDDGVTPEVIDGENNGGNRTCEEVWSWFVGDQVDWECGVDFLCGDKVDYDDDPEGFASSFPDGLTVTVTGIHIEFEVDDCLEFEGVEGFWKVGAVIVKGSNAANVYYYPDGETHDWGLAAPGDKHMVSNLTFCFVPCTPVDEPEWVIALKSYYAEVVDEVCVDQESWVKSGGGTAYGDVLGITYHTFDPLVVPNVYDIYKDYGSTAVGTISAQIVNKVIEEVPTDCMEITIAIDHDDDKYYNFNDSYLYFGSLAGLTTEPPYYTSFPYKILNDDCAPTRVFLINLSTMLLVE